MAAPHGQLSKTNLLSEPSKMWQGARMTITDREKMILNFYWPDLEIYILRGDFGASGKIRRHLDVRHSPTRNM